MTESATYATLADAADGTGWNFHPTYFEFPQSAPTLARLTMDNIDPARSYELDISLTAAADLSSGKAFMRVQHQLVRFDQGDRLRGYIHTFTIDPTRPLYIEIQGELGDFERCAAMVKLRNLAPQPGPSRIALLAWLPRPETASAVLGQAIIGNFTLPDPAWVSDWFTVGKSRLGAGLLRAKPGTHYWQNISSHATKISTSRGIDYNGFAGRAEIGQLQVSIFNALDPRASGLVRGVPVNLIDTETRTRIFTGKIAKTVTTPEKDGTYTVEITAHDLIADLAAVQKYQMTKWASAHWSRALLDLLDGYPLQIVHEPKGETRPAIGTTAAERSLTAYVDMVCATAGATWFVSCDGQIIARGKPETSPAVELTTDTHGTTLPEIALHDANAEIDTSRFISTIEASDHYAERDDDGDFQDRTRTIRATNPTLEATYGRQRTAVDTCAFSVEQLHVLLSAAVASYEPRQVLRTAQINPWRAKSHHRDAETLGRILALEILDPVAASLRGTTATEHITGISHQITPHSWSTTIELTQWKE